MRSANSIFTNNEFECEKKISPFGFGVQVGDDKKTVVSGGSSIVSKLTEPGLDNWGRPKLYLLS